LFCVPQTKPNKNKPKGNYGETGWLGINEVLKSVPQGIIQSSVAKMNEHYLFNADYDERLYTMCHELGHGYGLPHTDENFNNQDMGNCLDYTNNPSKNLRPGVVNCNRLQEMYGTINIGRRRRRQQRRTRTTAAGKGDINDTNKERKLRYRSDAELYEDFFDDDVDADIDDENNEEEEDNDIQHPRGGDFSRKLNDGFILEVHVLFPNNKE
jgi:hypothetical protein